MTHRGVVVSGRGIGEKPRDRKQELDSQLSQQPEEALEG